MIVDGVNYCDECKGSIPTGLQMVRNKRMLCPECAAAEESTPANSRPRLADSDPERGGFALVGSIFYYLGLMAIPIGIFGSYKLEASDLQKITVAIGAVFGGGSLACLGAITRLLARRP